MQDTQAAVMAVEVAGYSRLVAEDADETRHQVLACRSTIEECARSHDGRVIEAADGLVLLQFASGTDALRCGLAVQESLHIRNEAFEPSRQIHLRLGIGAGEAANMGEGWSDEATTVATRLARLALPGGICICDAVRLQADRALPVAFKDIGEQTAGEGQSVHAYAVERQALGQSVRAVAPKPHPEQLARGSTGGVRPYLIASACAASLLLLLWAVGLFTTEQVAHAPSAVPPVVERSDKAPAQESGLASSKPPAPDASQPKPETAGPLFDPAPASTKEAARDNIDVRIEPPAKVEPTDVDPAPRQVPAEAAAETGLKCLRYIPETSMSIWVPCGGGAEPQNGSEQKPASAAGDDLRPAPARPQLPRVAGPLPLPPKYPDIVGPSSQRPAPAPPVLVEQRRRPLSCANIMERAQLGELTSQDKAFLQTNRCR